MNSIIQQEPLSYLQIKNKRNNILNNRFKHYQRTIASNIKPCKINSLNTTNKHWNHIEKVD